MCVLLQPNLLASYLVIIIHPNHNLNIFYTYCYIDLSKGFGLDDQRAVV